MKNNGSFLKAIYLAHHKNIGYYRKAKRSKNALKIIEDRWANHSASRETKALRRGNNRVYICVMIFKRKW